MNNDHETAAELFAEWAKTQFDNQSDTVTADFFRLEDDEEEKDQE